MTEEKSIIVIAALEVRDAETFKKHALEIVRLTRSEAGCLRYDLLLDAENPKKFVFIEEYTDARAFEVHRNMPYMAPFRKLRESLVEKYLGVEELKRLNRR